jgi:hypothetical protein
LSNKNENATVSKSEIFSELNKAMMIHHTCAVLSQFHLLRLLSGRSFADANCRSYVVRLCWGAANLLDGMPGRVAMAFGAGGKRGPASSAITTSLA